MGDIHTSPKPDGDRQETGRRPSGDRQGPSETRQSRWTRAAACCVSLGQALAGRPMRSGLGSWSVRYEWG